METNLRPFKQTMGAHILHCQRLAGVMEELTVFALVYHPVPVVMLEVEQRQGGPWSGAASSIPCGGSARTPGGILAPLVVNLHRPDRVELRAIKHRSKPYLLLTKPRREAWKSLRQQSIGT